MTEVKLPELKENVDTVEVNSVMVAPGDQVEKDQPLLEVQADKAALDVPAPVAGRIKEVRVKTGDQVKVGQVFCVIDAANGEQPARKEAPPPEKGPPLGDRPGQKQRAGGATVEQRVDEPRPEVKPRAAPRPAARKPEPAAPRGGDGEVVPAGPATRRMAREFGIDLKQVPGSGRHGRVTEEDIRAYVKQLASGTAAPAVGAIAAPSLPRFEDFGPVEREPLSKVRRLTAQQMALTWSLIPHVTQHDEADVTELEAFRKSQSGKGPKLTVTAFALKAVAVALKQFPAFNASLDLANNQLVLKRYYHVGVAVDTERGLLVPVIRDVDKKSVEHLAVELAETAEQARQGKADMSGGTFTVTNLGGIGGTGFTPIVNHPEVAILGLSRGRWQPVVRDGQVTPRLMLPLSLSYDHRVIDGAAAARFTRLLAEMLENPWIMVLKG